MKDILKAIKNILLTNWPALAAVVLLSVILKLQFGYSVILCLVILLVLYFVLGCLIEYIMQSYAHYKKVKRGKSEEQLKREAEIRERRRTRGLEMINEEQKKKAEADASSEEVPRFVRRRGVYNTESAPREVKTASAAVQQRAAEIRRKRTPFDIAPPTEDISPEKDFPEFTAEPEKISTPEASVVEEVNDDVYVHTEELDELYGEELNRTEGSNTEAEEQNFYEDVSENAGFVVPAADINVEDVAETAVSEENAKEEVYEPISVEEMKQTSADMSREIQSRVNTHRRRSHIIFDPYENTEPAVDENVVFDEPDENTSLHEDAFDDGFDSPSTDAVQANQDKLDELYSEKSEESENKPKEGFFSRAFSGFKKKRRDRNKR